MIAGLNVAGQMTAADRSRPSTNTPGPTVYESRGVVGFALTRSLVAQLPGVISTG